MDFSKYMVNVTIKDVTLEEAELLREYYRKLKDGKVTKNEALITIPEQNTFADVSKNGLAQQAPQAPQAPQATVAPTQPQAPVGEVAYNLTELQNATANFARCGNDNRTKLAEILAQLGVQRFTDLKESQFNEYASLLRQAGGVI